MEKDNQDNRQPPSPPQGQSGQPDYDLWQYDQQSSAPVPPRAVPQHPFYPPPPTRPEKRAKPLPLRYQEPIADMGTSLGYGQSMEYQYFEPPQPSQALPQLRMERLQQLQRERIQQKHSHNPDITTVVQKRQIAKIPPLRSIQQPLQSLQPPPTPSQPLPMPYSQPVDATSIPLLEEPQLAASAGQDTGMIKKARMGHATLILTGAFVISRVMGVFRSSLSSGVFGANGLSDTFIQSSFVPDTIFAIVAGGALSSAFIPVFTKYMVGEKDEKTAWHIANTALTLATTTMVILAIIASIFARPLVLLYNPLTAHTVQDLAAQNAEIDMIASLMRLMFIQSVILGSGVIINAVLNARQNFTLPAIGIALYNLGPILGLLPSLYLKPLQHPQNAPLALYCASAGVVLAAILQVAVQIPGLAKVGMHFKLSFDWRNPGVLQIGRQMIPRIINASMFSCSVFVDRLLIGLLSGSVSGKQLTGLNTQYYQASQLMLLPLGIFGMAISTAAFPTLAEYVSLGRMERVRNLVLETLRSILFLSIPSSIGLIVLGLPIIQALLEHGGYTLDAAKATAIPLGCFAIGLGGLAAVEILTRTFYAMRDSKTPVIISVLQFAFKIALGILLITPFVNLGGISWGLGALAFSTAFASILEAICLFLILHQRIGELTQKPFFIFIWRVFLATLGMGIVVFIVRTILDFAFNTTQLDSRFIAGTTGVITSMIKIAIEIMIGTFVYLRLARLLKLEELGPVRRLLDRFKLSWML